MANVEVGPADGFRSLHRYPSQKHDVWNGVNRLVWLETLSDEPAFQEKWIKTSGIVLDLAG